MKSSKRGGKSSPAKRRYDSDSDSGSESESESSHGDGDHVEPQPGKRPRASYAASFDAVVKRQKLKTLKDGSHTFKSAITDDTHVLDQNMHETFPKAAKKGGFITQRPALDHHPLQYALLEKAHDERVHAERAKKMGRRLSVDLADGFARAAADHKNLRVVTHAEHVASGASQKKADFSSAQMKRAHAFIESHMPAVVSGPGTPFGRPKWHTSLTAASTAAPARTIFTRSSKGRK